MSVAGVVLAAGAGRRMGQPKAGVVLDGTPLVRRAAAVLMDGGCTPLGVVVGAAADDTTALLDGLDVRVLHNPAWDAGMATSVEVALRWAGDTGADAVMLLPVDTPGIGAAVVRRLVGTWQDVHDTEEVAGVVPTYDGRPRNPVVLGAAVLDEVVGALEGDSGARGWVAANGHRLRMVACADVGDPTDLDTPADLARWSAHPPDQT